jgi:hypothetical protein
MASEVRDDVPAMLSEGEYIVPADVVRYYGVKFFEDLRGQAKSGLMDMERNGRIGGEPVGAPEDDLTPEEMQMLAEISGMYAGGDVRRPAERSMSVSEALANMSVYEAINSPVRVFTPEGAEATTPEMKRELFRNMGLIQIAEESGNQPRRAFQQGGVVDAPFTPIPNYNIPGFSLFQPTQTAAPVVPTQTQNVTLYGPNGEVVTLTLPTDQERYNQLIAQGYTTQPVSPTGVNVAAGGDSDSGVVAPVAPTLTGGRERDYKPIDPDDYNALLNDPIAFGNAALEGRDLTRMLGGLGSFVLGPLGAIIGGGIGAGMTAQNVAQAQAARQIAAAKGLDTTELDAKIESYISGLPNLARGSTELLGAGDKMAERFFQTGRDLSLPGAQYGDSPFTRDFFAPGAAGDKAFTEEMQKTAPPGMVYDPALGGYVGDPNAPPLGERLGGTLVDTSDSGTPVYTPGPSTTRPTPAPRPVTPTPKPTPTLKPAAPTPAPAPPPPPPPPPSRDDRDDNDSGSSFAPTSSPRPTARPDRDSDSSGSDDGSVICTALYNLGLLDPKIYRLDSEYGAILETQQPEVLVGYRKLATPLAEYIQKNTLGARFVRSLVTPVAKAWASEMAHIMQPDTYRGNTLGKTIIKIGYPVCAYVGKNTKEATHAT